MSVFCSLCVFLFSAVSLVVPSGFSYGPAFLVLISLALLYVRPRISFQLHDWVFILTLAGYSLINVLLNIYHDLPANTYDKLLRYLLVIPVYFLLISYPPKQSYFLWGMMFGALGAAAIAVLQQFELFLKIIWPGRSSGFLNPIQFGNISLLMSVLLLPFSFLFLKKGQNMRFVFLMLFASGMGFLASFLSLSRGGWIAIPFVLLVLYCLFTVNIKKFLSLVLICFSIMLCLYFLPQSSSFRERINYTKIELGGLFQRDTYDVSTSAGSRMIMWQNGIDAFKAQPILGWGGLDLIKSKHPAKWNELNNYDPTFNHLHNEYIDALAKKGIVGFTALMAMYLIPLYYFIGLIRTREADVMPFAAAGVVLILCVMVFGLTQCFLAHNSGTMVFVFYLVIIKAYCRNIVASRGAFKENSF